MTSRSTSRSRRSRSSLAIALALLALPLPAGAQAGATFRILQHGAEIGVTSSSVAPEPEGEPAGWVIRGSSYLGGDYKLTVRRFEAHYDPEWRARFATMELSTPGSTLVAHTAIQGSINRTDVVEAGKTAYWGSAETSPDTIVIPDMVFSAYEALVARLARSEPGATLPIFVLPLSEIRLTVEAAATTTLDTASGPVTARHWKVTFQTATRHAPAEIWAVEGRLARVDMPLDGISVIRTDIRP
jgi:hypothetical protein